MKLLIWLTLVCMGVGLSNGECPTIAEVPTLHPTISDTFTCARYYTGMGDPDVIQACNNCYDTEDSEGHHIPDGASFNSPPDSAVSMGSLMVKEGCVFYGFSDYNYLGEIHSTRGPAVKGWEEGFHQFSSCGPGYVSYKCRCQQKLVSCIPDDQYEMVLTCDGSNALASTECNYLKSIGTTFTQETQSHMNVSASVEAEMKAHFFGLFSSELGTSVSTGYDWTDTSSMTMDSEQTFEVSAEVPPGLILTIEQAIGHCGDNTAKTEMFRINHVDPSSGKVIQSELVKTRV